MLKALVHLTFKELLVLLLTKNSVQLPSVLTDLLNRLNVLKLLTKLLQLTLTPEFLGGVTKGLLYFFNYFVISYYVLYSQVFFHQLVAVLF